MNAVFIYDEDDLDAPVPGGVQLCTQEFLAIIKKAAQSTVLFPVTPDRTLGTRLKRKLRVISYRSYAPEQFRERLQKILNEKKISHVFINRSELMRFSSAIKAISPRVRCVIMSHGNQSGDDLYEISGVLGRRRESWARLAAIWQLGLDIVSESTIRHRDVDLVAVMSNEEAVLERWLGASNVVTIPRLVSAAPLPWAPVRGRIGYVGTLDHTPNRAALDVLLRSLDRKRPESLEVRLVGSPVAIGETIAREFSFVRYLGRLDEDALETEAKTWELFLNPIFWLSRGASMKLGKAFSWQIPVVTTISGARGYEWTKGTVPTTADNSQEFAEKIVWLSADPERIRFAQRASVDVVRSSPTVDDLARRLAAACV